MLNGIACQQDILLAIVVVVSPGGIANNTGQASPSLLLKASDVVAEHFGDVA
jgi:hypothetical protein